MSHTPTHLYAHTHSHVSSDCLSLCLPLTATNCATRLSLKHGKRGAHLSQPVPLPCPSPLRPLLDQSKSKRRRSCNFQHNDPDTWLSNVTSRRCRCRHIAKCREWLFGARYAGDWALRGRGVSYMYALFLARIFMLNFVKCEILCAYLARF